MAESASDRAAHMLLAAATLLAGGVAFAGVGQAHAQSYWSRAAGDGKGRPVSDQDVARDNRERGELWPLGDLLPIATREGRGRYLGVETSTPIYRFKFLRNDGEVVWVDVDARSGRVVRVRP